MYVQFMNKQYINQKAMNSNYFICVYIKGDKVF